MIKDTTFKKLFFWPYFICSHYRKNISKARKKIQFQKKKKWF